MTTTETSASATDSESKHPYRSALKFSLLYLGICLAAMCTVFAIVTLPAQLTGPSLADGGMPVGTYTGCVVESATPGDWATIRLETSCGVVHVDQKSNLITAGAEHTIKVTSQGVGKIVAVHLPTEN